MYILQILLLQWRSMWSSKRWILGWRIWIKPTNARDYNSSTLTQILWYTKLPISRKYWRNLIKHVVSISLGCLISRHMERFTQTTGRWRWGFWTQCFISQGQWAHQYNWLGIKNIFRDLQVTKCLHILFQFQINLIPISSGYTNTSYVSDSTTCTYIVEPSFNRCLQNRLWSLHLPIILRKINHTISHVVLVLLNHQTLFTKIMQHVLQRCRHDTPRAISLSILPLRPPLVPE